MNKIGPYMISN